MPIDPIRVPGLLPLPGQSTVRPMFKTLGIAGSGLSAQSQRMDSIAQNIANAGVTRGPDGQPYKRRETILESATSQNAVYPEQSGGLGGASGNVVFGTQLLTVPSVGGDSSKTIEVPVLQYRAESAGSGANGGEYGVRVTGIAEDQGPGQMIYEPNHPDADARGFVRYPDVDTTQEMVKLLEAKRLYEANASVFQTAKSILRASLDI